MLRKDLVMPDHSDPSSDEGEDHSDPSSDKREGTAKGLHFPSPVSLASSPEEEEPFLNWSHTVRRVFMSVKAGVR